MAVPVPSISICVLTHHNLFYLIQIALAFNWDTCCHLAHCLWLLPFHWVKAVYLFDICDHIKSFFLLFHRQKNFPPNLSILTTSIFYVSGLEVVAPYKKSKNDMSELSVDWMQILKMLVCNYFNYFNAFWIVLLVYSRGLTMHSTFRPNGDLCIHIERTWGQCYNTFLSVIY
jgi:hypothetical protein